MAAGRWERKNTKKISLCVELTDESDCSDNDGDGGDCTLLALPGAIVNCSESWMISFILLAQRIYSLASG